jgi:hypothetical protein
LTEVYDGHNTSSDGKADELVRLVNFARERGLGMGWVSREYRKLFGRAPVITIATQEERTQHMRQQLQRGRPAWLARKITAALFGK